MIFLDSLWSNTAQMPSFERLNRDLKTDVLIIGGGLAGLLCAYFLDREGVDYSLVEAGRICNSVSSRTTAKITSQHGLIYDRLSKQFGMQNARLYWQSQEQALAQYRILCRDIDCDFEEQDAYVYGTNCIRPLLDELNALEKMGCPAQLCDHIEPPVETVGAIRFGNQAQFHPLKFAANIAKGLHIYENTKALEFDGRNVVTDGGTITADKIIVTTHFPLFNKHGGYFLKLYQSRSYVMALKNAPKISGMYVDEAENGFSFRTAQGLLLLGSGGHRTGKQSDGWMAAQRFVKRHYPKAQERYRWATQDCMSLDGIAYIGQYSESTPNLYVATGFNKWGMTSAMTAGMLLKDLVLEKQNPYADLFSPARTVLRKQLWLNLAETAASFLTPTTPRCPHLGCALKWNAQEHSWDCSCHGSRFSKEGKLLNNPSTDDLEKRIKKQ